MIAGRYRIDTELRRGAFGVIYKGIYEKRGEPIAIKMDYSSRSSLKHEIRIIQYLSMANVKGIPNIYWYGQYEDKPCVVMTLYECSLYDYQKRGSPTGVHLSKIMWLLLDMIENIHKHWVLHRDIKPHNFMIKGGEFFLIDFGLATFYMNENGEHCPDDGTQTMIGSPYFASLRIHEGHRYSRRDDLISLGYVILFMTGFSWDITTQPTNGSPLDLSYPINRELQCQKGIVVPMDIHLRYFIDYVYKLEYDENPKYQAMKKLFCLL
jgi:serine/threonine protein kinase